MNRWIEIKMESKKLQKELEQVEVLLDAAIDSGIINDTELCAYGIKRITKSNGYDDRIIPFLKSHGLRQCIKVKEIPMTDEINNAIANDPELIEQVNNYKKSDSSYYQMKKGMEA